MLCLITALVERGYIERLPNRARAIEIRRLPEGYSNLSNDNSAQNNIAQTTPPMSEQHQIPLMGKIAAGTPIEAIRDESSFIDGKLSASFISSKDGVIPFFEVLSWIKTSKSLCFCVSIFRP